MDGEHERGPLGDGLEVVQAGVKSESWLSARSLEPEAEGFVFLRLPGRDIGRMEKRRTGVVSVLADEVLQPFAAELDPELFILASPVDR
jgi:hypothetical protein